MRDGITSSKVSTYDDNDLLLLLLLLGSGRGKHGERAGQIITENVARQNPEKEMNRYTHIMTEEVKIKHRSGEEGEKEEQWSILSLYLCPLHHMSDIIPPDGSKRPSVNSTGEYFPKYLLYMLLDSLLACITFRQLNSSTAKRLVDTFVVTNP